MARPNPTKTVEVHHWVRKGKAWRLETEQISETDYCLRIAREPKGWYKGARINSVSKSGVVQ